MSRDVRTEINLLCVMRHNIITFQRFALLH